jgi:hypothetical protein
MDLIEAYTTVNTTTLSISSGIMLMLSVVTLNVVMLGASLLGYAKCHYG